MTYYIRYALTDDRPIELTEIKGGLHSVNPNYFVDADMIVLGDNDCGKISIEDKLSDMSGDDLALMKESAEQSENSDFLLAALHKATSLVVVQAFFSGHKEETSQILQAMLKWLMENRSGLLMDEDGSFYWNPDDLADLAA